MKKLHFLLVLFIPLLLHARECPGIVAAAPDSIPSPQTLILRGNFTDGKFQQVNYKNDPWPNDSSGAEIDAYCTESWVLYQIFSRAILRYDISEIPPGSTINSATLYLYGKTDNNISPGYPMLGQNPSYLQRIVAPWSSAELDRNANPAAVTFAGRQVLDETNEAHPSPDYVVDVTHMVQHWMYWPQSNYGMELQLEGEQWSFTNMIFHSAQAPDSLQPRLEINYTPAVNRTCTASITDSMTADASGIHYFTPVTSNDNGQPPVSICWSSNDGLGTCINYDSSHPYTGEALAHRVLYRYWSWYVCMNVQYADGCTTGTCIDTKAPPPPPENPDYEGRKITPGVTTAPVLATLYPNPVKDALTLHIQSNKAETGAVYLYDMQGRLLQVLKRRVQYAVGDNTIHMSIDRSRIHAGIHLVRVKMGNKVRTYKVMIQ